MKKAAVAGATGLVGRHIVKELINSRKYDEIHILTRRRTPFFKHPLVREHIVSFEELEGIGPVFEEINDIFVALGTTMKQAKSHEEFIKVDYTYSLKIAELAKEYGADTFTVVSATGANRESRFFYNRVKGTLEEALISLNLPSLHIFRPSLLIGERYEFRAGEKSAEWLSKPLSIFMKGPLDKYKPVKGSYVAASMYAVAQKESRGLHIYESPLIQRLGKVLKN
ncbi:NAD-dependent epimerase/dehydratase family protein [Salipaludibacillus sp. CUR1]|uniref:NAD-dependent epimerase/dehydratase family protein n=1 Tax=Salipaludibacillus sp. CUR1 TaxID=2820003 RepID=UPI001E65B52B|nr:NAD-dependent epimerase/dehydratase family protein [Salipaludibacillus sp. CUR1]MCE7791372.1 NAD-dependent epimerase/dehydratase family protein [Salipaludibacillus sp. CUR1]